MSIRSRIERWRRSNVFRALRGAASLLIVGGLLALGYLGGHWLSPVSHSVEEGEGGDGDSAVVATALKLPAEKVAAAEIETTVVKRRPIGQRATVPGELRYDELRHVELLMPADGVVDAVLVQPGAEVAPGQVIARLSSDAVAVARNEVLRQEAQVRVVQTRYAWQQEVHENLLKLLAALEKGEPLAEIERQFAKRSLGENREKLLATYSEFIKADGVLRQSRELNEQGVISGRVYQERLAAREQAAARYRGLSEQLRFESVQSLSLAEAELQVAQRDHAAAVERLRLLLGPYAHDDSAKHTGEFELHAPFAGRVVELRAVPSLRVAKGALLCVVADPSRLWLSARIHQRHWAATHLPVGQKISFQLPAFAGRDFEARVHYVGTETIPGTHSVPLVATVENADGALRPGMFAWVTVPLSEPVMMLAVPRSAIQRHEGESFVFVRGSEGEFRRVNIVVEAESDEWVGIRSGVKEGDRVVSRGAFFLKSELLLEREVE